MATASAKAFEIIREKILNGTFEPGQHLKEEELVQVCGVSRTPVRDALRRLGTDRYVVTKPNLGTFVNSWSVKDIMDIFDLRAVLEGFGARLAAQNHTTDHYEIMESAYQAISEMLMASELDVNVFLYENNRFHEAMSDAADNDPLKKQISSLIRPPIVAKTARWYTREDLINSNDHHRELLDAFSSHDGAWAEAVMRTHILSAKRKFLRVIDADTEAAEG